MRSSRRLMMAQARLQYAELLLSKGRRAEAIRELEQISAKAAPKLRVKAKLQK